MSPQKHLEISPDQGSMLTSAVYDREAILEPEAQYRTSQTDQITPLPITEVSLLDRSGNLIDALGLLAEAGSLGGADKSRYLSGPEPDNLEDRYGETGAAKVRDNALKKKERLEAQAEIRFAGGAGYIPLGDMNHYLSLYERPKYRRKGEPPFQPPREIPLPDAVKCEIEPEFRKFRELFDVPQREGAAKIDHQKNLERHAKARSVLRRQLRSTAKRILKQSDGKRFHD